MERDLPQLAVVTPAPALDFESIYLGQIDYLWVTLRRLGVGEADLADVAHDVFITVHRRIGSYDATRPVRPWLFAIALRVAANHRRSVRRRREVAVEHEAVDVRTSADERLAQQRNQHLVFDALDRLSEGQRTVFVLHELEGKPAPVIASELDVPVNTVYSRLRLAHKRFSRVVEMLRKAER